MQFSSLLFSMDCLLVRACKVVYQVKLGCSISPVRFPERKNQKKEKKPKFGLLSAVEIILAGAKEPIPNF